nr:hypothetical protein [Tanacetum cinerariifolium]
MSDWEALNEQVAKLSRALKQFKRQILSGQYNCSCCGDPQNDGSVKFNNSLIIMRSMEVPIIGLIVKPGTSLSMSLLWDTNRILEELLRTLKTNPHIGEPEGVTITWSYHGAFRHLFNKDEVVSTILARENNEFIKSSVNDFVPIPKESEVTSVSIDFKCGIPIETPPSPYLVDLGDEKINLLLRDDLDILLTKDREIDFNPSWDIEELEHLLANDLVHVPRVFDEPLSNSDLMSRSIETIDLILEELTTEIGLDDSIPTEINDAYYDSEGDIVYFK